MHSLTISRDFIAQHFLIGGDWGAENQLHSHHYRLEIRIKGRELDRHGYLVDIVDLERVVVAVLARFRDRTLNDLPEFSGQNPSVERLARILWDDLNRRLTLRGQRLIVRVWENDTDWAGYEE
jgi:6-pyruvoyltetrahydropterin/6-carboxytetrahydropterin synthase